MKRGILIITLVTFMISSVGCWDYIEYEQITQVYSLGIDLNAKSNKITFTVQYIPVTKAMGEKAETSTKGTVYSASGISMIEALNKLQQASPNKLFFGYLQIIVISENAAKNILKDLIVFFDRTPIIRNSVNIIIVPGSAEGTIATRDPNSVTSSGKKMRMLLNSARTNGYTYSVTLQDFRKMMDREGVEPVAPRILTTASSDDPGESSGGTRNDVRFAVEKEGNLLASGMAAIKKEKFVGWLNDKETLGLNWILGDKIANYKTSMPTELSANDSTKDLPLYADIRKILYYYITKSKSKIIVKIENNEPVVYVNIKIEAALRKYYSDEGTEYITPEIVSSMEKMLESSIYSDVKAALEKCKNELDVDIFGFGYELYRQHPKEWHKYYEKTWDNIFQSTRIEVNVEAKVNNTGTNLKRFITK